MQTLISRRFSRALHFSDERVSDEAGPHNRIRHGRPAAADLCLGDVWITGPADLGRVLCRETERPLRGGLTIAPAKERTSVAAY